MNWMGLCSKGKRWKHSDKKDLLCLEQVHCAYPMEDIPDDFSTDSDAVAKAGLNSQEQVKFKEKGENDNFLNQVIYSAAFIQTIIREPYYIKVAGDRRERRINCQ